jgi:hypothetical protein
MITPDIAIGAWCPITRGFYCGGRYVAGDMLTPGDEFRWTTYTGYRVARIDADMYQACAVVDITTDTGTRIRLSPLTIVEVTS